LWIRDGKRSLVTRSSRWQGQDAENLAKAFTANPTTLFFHDVDQDGFTDLVGPNSLRKSEDSAPGPWEGLRKKIDVAPPGGEIQQPWLSAADIDGDGKPELLLTQKNFLRAVVLKRESESTKNSGWIF